MNILCFRLASVSKTFAAELTAIMVEQQLLGWDDQVTSYLPEFRYKDQQASQQLPGKTSAEPYHGHGA